MYKLVGPCALLAFVAANDLKVGSGEGEIVFDEKVEASPALFWRQIKNITVNVTEHEVISRVVVTDLRPLKDGEAAVVEGGVGHNNVTIELKSPAVLRGFEFKVEVYAVPQYMYIIPNGQKQESNPQDNHGKQLPEVRPSQQTHIVDQKPQVPEVPPSQQTHIVDQKPQVPEVPSSQQTHIVDQKPQVPAVLPTSSVDSKVTTPSVDNEGTTPSVGIKVTTASVSSEATTISVAPINQSTPAPTTQANKGDAKTNIPVKVDKEEPTTKPSELIKEDTDVVDELAVRNQPTHLNNSHSEKPEQVPNGLKDLQSTTVRQTEETSTKGDVTSTTVGHESITEVKHQDKINPPKAVGSEQVAVNPASKVPLPYKH